MAFSNDLGELEMKVHYDYYGKDRCTPVTMEFVELFSLGFIGVEALVKSQIPYLGRMPAVRISYKDEEDDYVDLSEKNFSRFIRMARKHGDSNEVSVINIKVSEGLSPANFQKRKPDDGNPEEKPSTSRKTLDFNEVAEDSDVFTYKSPLEYSIQCLKEEVEETEAQVESAKEHLDILTSKYNNPNINKGRGKQCSNCHLRLDHNMRQCTIEKCLTGQQCGDVAKHPEERQILDSASEQLKKLERALKIKINEYDTRMKGMTNARTSFAQKIRGALINSNKERYLVKTGEGIFVPKSGLVNVDIAKLEKHFKGKVPDNLETAATTFKGIIDRFDKGIPKNVDRNSARKSLEENSLFPVKFPRTSAAATSPVNETTPDPDLVQRMTGAVPVMMYRGATPSAFSTGQQTVWFVQTPPAACPLPPKKRHGDTD